MRECGKAARCRRRCALSSGESVEPSTASWAQRPRYSSRIQVSTRLAVAASGSASAREVSAQKGLVAEDAADHLPVRDCCSGRDR
jgi:hypothetical protein